MKPGGSTFGFGYQDVHMTRPYRKSPPSYHQLPSWHPPTRLSYHFSISKSRKKQNSNHNQCPKVRFNNYRKFKWGRKCHYSNGKRQIISVSQFHMPAKATSP
ncbi:hypothetical protein HYFRA_00002461 [Hymenoscyphus fraxineus]|uniref:Uncharacterized protein n=1 Tax=Hymenoscyphus fraxineus TaxID=746836 RepID=A0A9N9PZD3_9HELO|nr:hypothetical protein HYFRA_00002461 [Hymenoscyphus fraxineus]